MTGPVSQATLRLWVQSSSTVGYKVHMVADNSWGEMTTTYNNAPTIGSVIDSSGAITADSWVDIESLP